jgi:cell division protein FtsL
MMAKKKSLRGYTALGSISTELVLQNLPFVFFLGFLATIYIANAHFAESRIREIQTMQSEVKELKRKYNSLKSEVMFNSRHSALSESVRELGLKRMERKPYKLVVEQEP